MKTDFTVGIGLLLTLSISDDLYKMASAEFIDQALSTNVDENAVNAIVGSLENQLVTSVCSVSSQNNFVNVIPSQNYNLTSNTNSLSGSQKYIVDQINSSGVVNNFHSNLTPNCSVSFNNVHSPNLPFTSLSLTGSHEPLKVITSHASPLSNLNGVAFSTQSLNGCIAQPSSQSQLFHAVTSGVIPQQGNKALTMQPSLVIKQGANTGQVGMQPGMVTVPMTVNSSMPASIPNVMTLNKPGGQNVVLNAQNLGSAQPPILPNVQILNMRPVAPAVAAQKSVATVSPRVVIGTPQVVGTRATAPITLQTLQSLQPGQQGHLLLKTENGQYQLLRVGPAPAANTLAPPQPQAIRLSSVPAHPGVATVSTSMAPLGPMPGHMPAPPMASPVVMSAPNIPTITQPTQAMPQMLNPVPPAHIKPSDNTKEKCRNFLANLLDLSSKEPPSVEMNVRNLIQELIDAQVEPEEFCDRLERLLNASPQPCLIGFLKKSLPLLRQSLVTKELIIEGINPPAPHIAYSGIAALAPPIGPPPPIAHSLLPSSGAVQILIDDDDSNSGGVTTLTPLLPPVLPLTLACHLPSSFANSYVCTTPSTVSQKPPAQKSGNTIAVLQNIPLHTPTKMSKSSKGMSGNSKSNYSRGNVSSGLSTVLTPGKSLLRDKERRAAAFAHPFGDDKMAGDDDINDVAAMGGVNLAEESQRILGSTDMIGTQIRSCKEEYLVPPSVMQARMKSISNRNELDEPPPEIAALLSHALQERMKTMIEKLAVIAQHRIDPMTKTDGRYEAAQDVKGQMKFLEELDRVDKKRREDTEREMLLKAAKSRSKNEDPEQAKLKAKAKEMQRAELEELRQREANLTALQAIGPRKKPRLEGPGGAGDSVTSHAAQQSPGMTGRSQMALRTRLKRINQRDMLYLLEQERDTSYSLLLYKSYLK